jgi:hypothetical protein
VTGAGTDLSAQGGNGASKVTSSEDQWKVRVADAQKVVDANKNQPQPDYIPLERTSMEALLLQKHHKRPIRMLVTIVVMPITFSMSARRFFAIIVTLWGINQLSVLCSKLQNLS